MGRDRGRVPFVERGGRLRGVLDLATGCYPAFLFGRPLGRFLPVFHIHEVTPAALEPSLRYLAENGYRTVGADEIAAYVLKGASLGDRAVALTFDDARASLWTVAAPLLRRHGLTAITFAIPARVVDAPSTRPTIEGGSTDDADESDVPFATWPELKALQASGTVEVQSHTLTHAAIFCDDRPTGFVTPDYARVHVLSRPLISVDGPPQFVQPDDIGTPLYRWRSRMSDALRFLPAAAIAEAATGYVRGQGGVAFFDRPQWRAELERVLPSEPGAFESQEARQRAIEDELDRGRSEIDARLGPGTVRHLALPWGVLGEVARRALGRGGYQTAYADAVFRHRSVRPGDDPFQLLRLNGKYIRCLPGSGRRFFFTAA